MQTDTGQIMTAAQRRQMIQDDPELAKLIRPMALPPTAAQAKRGTVGRNDPCPCGSGAKFKRCCYTGHAGKRR
jgi:uncharacterized protein YecA (UPF0149 family)